MMRLFKTIVLWVTLTALVAAGALATVPSQYSVNFQERNWHLKLAPLLDLIYDAQAALNTLVTNWTLTENYPVVFTGALQVDGDTLTVPNDQTAKITAGKLIWLDCGPADGVKASTVASSSFGGGLTTIEIDDAVATANLRAVSVVMSRNGVFPAAIGWVFGQDYGAPGLAALTAAEAVIGVNDRTLSLGPGAWAITDDHAVAANIYLKPEVGAVLQIATTKTLTISRGFIEAGHRQVFDCVGTGAVAGLHEVDPYWFYSGSGSWHSAFQGAVNACTTYAAVRVPAGDYSFSSGFTIPIDKYIALTGAGIWTTNFHYAVDYDGTTLISLVGTASPPSTNRNLQKTIAGLSIYGLALLGQDGKGIEMDYGVNATLRDIGLVNIRNIALTAAHQWDVQGYNIQTYNCGAADGSHTGTIPAWLVGEETSTGNNATNGATFIGCRIERSPEVGVRIRGNTLVRFIGTKFHGVLVTDANYENYLTHVWATNCTQVSFDSTCQFEGCRGGFGVDTVGVWGAITVTTENDGVTIVSLNNPRFNLVGDDFNLPTYGTYAIKFDPTGANATSSKLIVNGLEVNDAVRTNPIIYTGASAGDNAIQIGGPITIRDTVNNPPLFYNARADISNTVLHLEKYPGVQFPLFTAMPADTDLKDGGLGPLQSTDATAPLQSLLFHAGGKWRGVPQLLAASIATVTSGKTINAILPFLPTGLKYKVLALDVVCQTGPTEDYAGGAYWKIMVQGSGGSTETIILDAAQSTKTVLGGSAIMFSKRSGFGGNKWDNTTPVQIYPVQVGAPATPPAGVNVNVLVQPTS